ncbi:hypothetical protein MHU86_25224 [Fragilaria crotonensis]|nr:hypothetical protein MHU86_25224 [Fragilaria crotonensis]
MACLLINLGFNQATFFKTVANWNKVFRRCEGFPHPNPYFQCGKRSLPPLLEVFPDAKDQIVSFDVGIPEHLTCDFASEQTAGKHTDVMKIIRRHNTKLHVAEKGRGITQNHLAETEIREIKTKWKARMRSNQVPSRLWDYGLVYISEIQSILARGPDQRPGVERLTGDTVDISEWLDFYFYDRVSYWDEKKMDMTDDQAKIGRWLGIAHRVGSNMTYWILTESGTAIARSTVQHLTTADMATAAMQTRLQTFDANLPTCLEDENFQIILPDHVFHAVLKEITDHKKDRSALDIVNGFTVTKQGRRIPKTTTRGWKIHCQSMA